MRRFYARPDGKGLPKRSNITRARHLPGDDPDEIFQKIQTYVDNELLLEMKAICRDASIVFEPMAVIPSLDTDEDAEVTQLAKAPAAQIAFRRSRIADRGL